MSQRKLLGFLFAPVALLALGGGVAIMSLQAHAQSTQGAQQSADKPGQSGGQDAETND